VDLSLFTCWCSALSRAACHQPATTNLQAQRNSKSPREIGAAAKVRRDPVGVGWTRIMLTLQLKMASGICAGKCQMPD